MRVDLIIPFVDSADELWACEYYKEFGESPMSKFRGNEEIFKYNLRSIAKYLPWINQVYVLVMSESQIPKWLNTSTVKIIYHKDFIPEKYLPTFNECTIELFQHKIPGLSEHYLVGNDDYLVTAPLSREDFFTDEGIPKITWNKGLNIENVTPWCSIVSRSYQLFVKENAGDIWVPNHTYSPHCKQSWKELWVDYNDKLEASITKRADHCNFNQYAAQYYWLGKGKNAPGAINGFCYHFGYPQLVGYLYDLLYDKRQMLCLNDLRSEDTYVKEDSDTYKQVLVALNKKFPEKCCYEK